MLKTNPLPFFEKSVSPFARHAQARWGALQGGAIMTPPLTAPGQGADGSWNDSVHDTIRQLYARWLIAPVLDEPTSRGLCWLLEVGHPPQRWQASDGARYDDLFFKMRRGDPSRLRVLQGAPFSAGCSGFVKTGAALFLAQQFGLPDEEGRMGRAFASLARIPPLRRGWWCSASCGANIFQAFAVHPDYSRSPAMGLAIDYLAACQGEDGAWEGGIPFYETFNALSRLEDDRATRQFECALPRVVRAQAADGGWGRSDRELKAFLVLDALDRKGLAWPHQSG